MHVRMYVQAPRDTIVLNARRFALVWWFRLLEPSEKVAEFFVDSVLY